MILHGKHFMIKSIQTDRAPIAIGPYSQAVICENKVYTSGQLGLIPETTSFPEGGIKPQARQALQNLKAIFDAAGTSLDNAIKVTCFIKNMNDFDEFNEVYNEFFHHCKPARSCVEVSGLPKNALIELEAIGFIKSDSLLQTNEHKQL